MTLGKRRLRGDLIEMNKIITQNENLDSDLLFQFNHSNYSLRGHRYQLLVNRSRLNIQKFSFGKR